MTSGQLLDQTVALWRNGPPPGGGSAAAACAAIAAALLAMLERLAADGAKDELTMLQQRLCELSDQDEAVLKELLPLFGEGAAPESFQPLIRTAIAVPRAIAQASVSVLQRACLMASLLPAHTLGDLTVAAGIAHGAIEGVCQICLTNLPLLTAPAEQSELLTELRALIGEADACRVRLAQWTEKQEPYSLLRRAE